MVDIVLRSVLQEKTINDTIEFLEPDLHIITKEGVTIRTSKFLLGQGSPILRSLLSNGVNAVSTPSFLFLPDVAAAAILHFISVIKKGFTSGRGWPYPVIKQVREVAQLLGFQNIPLLTFVEPRGVEALPQSIPQVLNESVLDINCEEAEEVSTDSGNVKTFIQMETEGNQNEHDADYHIATSIDKETHQRENNKDEHQVQSVHQILEWGSEMSPLAQNFLTEHGQKEDELSQSSDFNLCNFEPLNLNSACEKTIVSKSPNKTKNMNEGEIEIHEFKSEEITETITKVLKKDPDDIIATEDVPKFPCGKCRKPFSCAATLLVHAEKHGKIKGKRKCILCNFSGLRTPLLAHIRSKHTKEKLFQCSVCQKKFSTSYSKNEHESLHTSHQHKEKLFICSVCNLKFSFCRAKNEHEKRHTSQVVL